MMPLRCLFMLMGLAALGATPAATTIAATDAAALVSVDDSITLDQKTERTLQAIVDGDWTTALAESKQLSEQFPDYALGRLLYAEALQVSAGLPLRHHTSELFSTNYMGLLLEAQARAEQPSAMTSTFANVLGDNSNELNENGLLPAAVIRSGSTVNHVIVVDLKRSYLMLYDTTDAQPRLVKRHYAASGLGGYDKRFEGDLKTPTGVYNIHGFRSDRSLPDLYGSGALMLDYPNALDKLLGRSGSGIWLHGVPHKQKSRAPRSSEGCVTMSNDYLLELHNTIDLPSTRVVLSDGIQWATPQQLAIEQEQHIELFEQYRVAWTQMNMADLQALYYEGAWPLAAKQHGLASALRRVKANQPLSTDEQSKHALTLAKATPKTLSVIAVPGTGDDRFVQMSFHHGDQNEIKTTLFWRQQPNGHWQIVSERNQDSNI